ncbi:Exodeoxyribonuclease VII large subunit [Bryocella elongata]|uniref:Exodeoxyribonuclease 7 large subunit n=1 Tax=Bryocella elongata TaxID=863522 RepID=A0A1H5W687_9BACT|nr:exodeoxyribonuclease VII large subunit [Bryocella elongata]SEF94930.1 Exodeoxyribonuclease VII large subunit [Bryocella elongata]
MKPSDDKLSGNHPDVDQPSGIPTLAELRRGRTSPKRRAPASRVSSGPPGLFDSFPAPEAPSPTEEIIPVHRPEPAVAAAREPVPSRATDAPSLPVADPTRVWSVSDLVRHVRNAIERGFGGVTVEGEISNWRPAASGHVYFTIKDPTAQLSIVMFRNRAQRLRFKPKDGDKVRVRGGLSLYESRGQMQMVAESMEPLGLGALLAAVRELKERLRREGLFDRKRPLPPFPRCIGVVTSAQGAALRDIVKVCRRRHAAVRLLIYPAAVQGPNCAREVAAGVNWFSARPELADVVLVARGGGSWEDLHGFDDELVARAIAACSVPVISGIGHATDTTIADAAADVAAPTPSAAAELVTAAHHQVGERLARLDARVRRAGQYELLRARQRFARLSAAMVLRRVSDALGQRAQKIDELGFRVEAAMRRRLTRADATISQLGSRLARQDVRRRLAADERRAAVLRTRLEATSFAVTRARNLRLEQLTSRLDALSPVKVLERGYALVYGADGRLLRSSDAASPGDTITARLSNGRLRASVLESSKS